MRIEVVGDESISAQARTYAEYRLFATLSRIVDTDRVRRARLALRRRTSAPALESGRVTCTIHVDVEGSRAVRVRVTAAHPYAAINDAVETLAEGRAWPATDAATPLPA